MIPLEAIAAEQCRRNFFRFFVEFWPEIETDELYINWHIPYLCDQIQKILEGVIRGEKTNDNLVVNICPGSSKSTIIIMAQAWLWSRRPDLVILSNTISDSNASKFSLKFRDLVTCEKYKLFYPSVVVRRDSAAIYRIQNTLGGARRQYTTKSKITGDHGHVRFDDDPMAFQDARSAAEAARCIDGYKAYSTRAKKNAAVPYILVSQRLSDIDTSAYVFKTKEDVKRIVLPAYDNGKVYPPELAANYTDGLMNPEHVGWDFLNQRKKELGELQYLAEFGQDTEAKEGLLYDLQYTEAIETKGLSIAATDPADDGDCYTATVYARVYNNRVWVHDVIYTQKGAEYTIPEAGRRSKRHQPFTHFCEKDGMGSLYTKQLKTIYPLVKPFSAKGQKDDRIYSRAVIVNEYFRFLRPSPSLEYENAVNSLTTYRRTGTNKNKDFADVCTALADILITNGLINIYEKTA